MEHEEIIVVLLCNLVSVGMSTQHFGGQKPLSGRSDYFGPYRALSWKKRGKTVGGYFDVTDNLKSPQQLVRRTSVWEMYQ